MGMEKITFQGEQYTKHQYLGACDFCVHSQSGEYMRYFDLVLIHRGEEYIAAYADDLDNYWNI